MILGIDQGTTGTRACVMALSGQIVSWAYKTHRQIHPGPGMVEHDPGEILENTLAVIREAMGRAHQPRIQGIGLANQGETVMLWDRTTGEPLHNAIVWQDTRTRLEMQALENDPSAVSGIAERTGLRPDSYFSASKIRWLLDNAPGAREVLQSGNLCAGTLDSWLIWHLGGRRAFVTDPSTAARTLLYNIGTLDYDDWLLGLFGVDRATLPAVVPSAGVFTSTLGVMASTGLPDGVPVVAGLVDQPAGMIGIGCLDAGEVKATFGTGCFVYMNTGNQSARSRNGLLSTVAWQRDGAVTYALDGGVFVAGSLVNWLEKMRIIHGRDEIASLVRAVRCADGVVCVPAMAGLAAPYWDRAARGAFMGLDLSTSRSCIVRAALEGIACRVAQVVNAMSADSGSAPSALRVDGGLSDCEPLMQIQADLLGIPIQVSSQTEATVAGVCFLAARAQGLWAGDQEIRRHVGTRKTFEPSISADERGEKIYAFERAVASVRSLGGGRDA
ncbi:MAG: glycerol kinase GlpK [Myxococcota bacterium]|jgi:glycerol kinase